MYKPVSMKVDREHMKSTRALQRNGNVVKNSCNLATSSIKVNNKEYSPKGFGHNVVVLDGKSGSMISRSNFDTKTRAWQKELSQYIDRTKENSIIIIATQVNLSILTSSTLNKHEFF